MMTEAIHQRSQLVLDKAIERVRKLLSLAKGTSEHEAALAASNAAKLIEQFQLSEAMIRLDEPEAEPEPIEKAARLEPELSQFGGRGSGRKRIAWKETIAQAVAGDLGIHMYWRNSVDMCGFGRESMIQTWRYTYQYLCSAVDQLAIEAWNKHRRNIYGETARGWKNAFRTGCASRLAVRIWEERQKRKEATRSGAIHRAVEIVSAGAPGIPEERWSEADAERVEKVEAAASRECMALAIVEKDQKQVDDEYKNYSKNWKGSISGIGSTSSLSGYEHGKAAGDRVSLGGRRAALKSGQGRLR